MSIAAIVEFLIVLGIMVLVHEFGHYAAAKLLGIRVEVFSIGFGTRLFGFTSGDTDYRVCALPLGGYVKMSGDQPARSQPTPATSMRTRAGTALSSRSPARSSISFSPSSSSLVST